MAKADVLFGITTGFVLGAFASGTGASLGTVAALTGSFYVMNRMFPKRRLVPMFHGVWVVALIAGATYWSVRTNLAEIRARIPPNGTAFTATVTEDPKGGEQFVDIRAKLDPPYQGHLRIITEGSSAITYGDTIRLVGKIEPPERPGGRYIIAYPKSVTTVSRGNGNPIVRGLLGIKHAFMRVFTGTLPENAAALLAGLLFGVTKNFSDSFRAEMQMSGTTHLVALSGYNILILVRAVNGMFRSRIGRRASLFVSCGVIGAFVAMVGGEASVVRAAIMGGLLILAEQAARPYTVRYAVALAACAMTVANPDLPAADIGFQLSFVSLIGIVVLEPALRTAFRTIHVRLSKTLVVEYAYTTLAAQFAVAPLLIAYFGSFSIASIAANVAILPVVPLTMAIGFGFGAIGTISPVVADIISFIPRALTGYIIGAIGFFARNEIPLRAPSEEISWVFAAAYYAGLSLFAMRMHRKEKQRTSNDAA